MTNRERKILGIADEAEARTLYEVVLAQATTLAGLGAKMESHDTKLESICSTVGELDKKLDEVILDVAKMPDARKGDIKEAVDACRAEHDKKSLSRRQRLAVYSALLFGLGGLGVELVRLAG